MKSVEGSLVRSEIDRAALAFEAAWFSEGRAELRDYLPAVGASEFSATLRELACIEIELCWSRGQRRYVEEYLREYPVLADDAEAVRELAEQEWRARLEAGDEVVETEYSSRLGLHLPLNPERESALASGPLRGATLPASALELKAGDRIAGFCLLCELGRGSFGRVFLAEQDDLARRQVVVKVGASLFDESQRLAQLQHSNIMPIYSAHRSGDLQLLCMPFLGRTTLDDALANRRITKQDQAASPAGSTLKQRASVTRNVRVDEAEPLVVDSGLSKVKKLSRELSGDRALAIVAQLAEGLAHAHDRGIVHRDLKPANVLLADDGTPLLLDFNLAADQTSLTRERVLLGGTLPYMAPEQLQSLTDGHAVLDGRSDLFALGVILFEMLTGESPFPPRAGPWNKRIAAMIEDRRVAGTKLPWPPRGVSPAVRAIVARCLAPDLGQRYRAATELAEDLRRQLRNLPLASMREPSLVERGQKFMRRYPRLAPLIAAAVLVVVVAVAGAAALSQGRRAARAEAANVRRQFTEELAEARMLLSLPFPQRDELEEGEQIIQGALARYGLPEETQWQTRSTVQALDTGEQTKLISELREGLMLQARAAWLAGRWTADSELRMQRQQQAQTLNQRAGLLAQGEERTLVDRQRRQFESGGNADSGSGETAATNPLKESPELLNLQAGASAAEGNYRSAADTLAAALRKQPENAALWAQFGACSEAIGKLDQAAAAYSTCIALRPAWWRSYLWRGRVWLELKEWEEAALDLDFALSQRPKETAALALRSLARIGQKDYAAAENDLSRAIELTPSHTRLYFMRSRVRGMKGDDSGAAADLALGLKLQPTDEVSWISRGMARLAKEPEKALADFEEALELNPWSREASQNKAHVLSERLGRTAEAIAALDPIVERFPDFVLARIGRGVLLAREGKRDLARQDAKESLSRDQRPLVLYQAACIHALNARQEPADGVEALALLQKVVREGFGAEWIEKDADLSSLREDLEFSRILSLLDRPKTAPPQPQTQK